MLDDVFKFVIKRGLQLLECSVILK